MRNLIDAFKPFRRIEILVAIALFCVLALLLFSQQSDSAFDDMTDLERRMCAVLSNIEGAGHVRVMIAENADGSCGGVVVVTEGAQNMKTCLTIQRAVRALTGVDTDCIEIVKGGSG